MLKRHFEKSGIRSTIFQILLAVWSLPWSIMCLRQVLQAVIGLDLEAVIFVLNYFAFAWGVFGVPLLIAAVVTYSGSGSDRN